jgi:hypothetical protein
MELRGHHFRPFKSVERICRCGFVIERNATPAQVEARMLESLGYVFECSGEWHVFPTPRRPRTDEGRRSNAR